MPADDDFPELDRLSVECPNCQHTMQIHVHLDGHEMRRVADEQIDKTLTALAESFSRIDAGLAKTTLASRGLLGPDGSSAGLQVGQAWARNVVTGLDEVL